METLREKCPNTEFFLVQIQENKDQKKLRIGHFSRSETYVHSKFSSGIF